MEKVTVLKAMADETRMNILMLLLRRSYCVRALAEELKLSEATVSQHLKVLREAGMLSGEKHGYYMHYNVEHPVLNELAGEITAMAGIEREACRAGEREGCPAKQKQGCHKKGSCDEEVKEMCHGKDHQCEGGGHHGQCQAHKH